MRLGAVAEQRTAFAVLDEHEVRDGVDDGSEQDALLGGLVARGLQRADRPHARHAERLRRPDDERGVADKQHAVGSDFREHERRDNDEDAAGNGQREPNGRRVEGDRHRADAYHGEKAEVPPWPEAVG